MDRAIDRVCWLLLVALVGIVLGALLVPRARGDTIPYPTRWDVVDTIPAPRPPAPAPVIVYPATVGPSPVWPVVMPGAGWGGRGGALFAPAFGPHCGPSG